MDLNKKACPSGASCGAKNKNVKPYHQQQALYPHRVSEVHGRGSISRGIYWRKKIVSFHKMFNKKDGKKWVNK